MFFQRLTEEEWLFDAETVVGFALDINLKNGDLVALDNEYESQKNLAK